MISAGKFFYSLNVRVEQRSQSVCSNARLGVWSRCESQYAKLFTTLLCMPQVVLRLLIDPAFCGGIKGNRKANSHLRADAGSAIQNSGQRFPANAESLCRLGHSEAKWIETKSLDDFPGMWRIVHSHDLASVVAPRRTGRCRAAAMSTIFPCCRM